MTFKRLINIPACALVGAVLFGAGGAVVGYTAWDWSRLAPLGGVGGAVVGAGLGAHAGFVFGLGMAITEHPVDDKALGHHL